MYITTTNNINTSTVDSKSPLLPTDEKTKPIAESFKTFFRDIFEYSPKFFGSGCGWQLFMQIAKNQGYNIEKNSIEQLGGYALIGVGDALGVGTGNFISGLIKMCYKQEVKKYMESHGTRGYLWKNFVESSGYGAAALFAGSLWQPVVNNVLEYGPILSMGLTGLACAVAFFLILQIGRYAIPMGMNDRWRDRNNISCQTLKEDALLSFWNVFGASASFVLTSFKTFLQTDGSCNLLKAGGATWLGMFVTKFFELIFHLVIDKCSAPKEYVFPKPPGAMVTV